MAINILLIEDNPDHILFTRKILEKTAGEYRLDSASEPKEGLKKLIEQNYDVVLCDYRMPGLTAFDMLKEMRHKGKDVPFIVVTASGNEKVAVGLMKEGAYDYIIKDVSYEDTLPVVVRRSLEIFNAKKEKERLEKKIEQAAQEWEATFNSITDLISIHDRDFRILRVNKVFKDMFKMSDEEIVNKKCHEIFHGTSDTSWPNCPHKRVLETKRPQQIEFFEPRFKIYLEVSVSPIFNEKGDVAATVHITKDITKRKKAEQKLADAYQELKDTQEQLIQSSKMAAMGQLAAGISHELNQPLTGIKGFAQAAHMDMEENNPLRGDINKIIEQADRMDKIIKNIRLFARKSDFEMQEIDVNQPIENAVMLLNEQLKVRNIRLKKQLGGNLPKIEGDLNQFQQVFLNLITNARDAIDSLKRPEGGELAIKTSLSEDKKNIHIYFQDTGCGIPKEHLGNIFNPFFTTKSPDGGIGLGLSIAYRIVENHKGRIEVRSKVNEGTTFKIIIPVNRVKT
jgi:PAS domain S-box-containing protein